MSSQVALQVAYILRVEQPGNLLKRLRPSELVNEGHSIFLRPGQKVLNKFAAYLSLPGYAIERGREAMVLGVGGGASQRCLLSEMNGSQEGEELLDEALVLVLRASTVAEGPDDLGDELG